MRNLLFSRPDLDSEINSLKTHNATLQQETMNLTSDLNKLLARLTNKNSEIDLLTGALECLIGGKIISYENGRIWFDREEFMGDNVLSWRSEYPTVYAE